MRDAERRTQHARALDHRRRHQVADLRGRLVLFAQACIAIKYRQRHIRPALMTDRAEIAVGDQLMVCSPRWSG